MLYYSKQIAEIVEGTLKGNPYNTAEHFYFDSRSIIHYNNSAFFAFKGSLNDGHEYIPQLIKAGVKTFIVENNNFKEDSNCSFIIVKNTKLALQKLATHHRKRFNIPVIGITGSYGKTIVKDWLFDILSEKFEVVKSPKSYNSQIGVPFSILLINEKNQIAIIEAGISEKGEMDNLAKIISPTIGVFTNIGDAHSSGFNSLEEKIQEKLRLFIDADCIFIPSKYSNVLSIAKKEYPHKKIFTWGTFCNDNLIVDDVIYEKHRSILSLKYNNNAFELYLPFVAEPYVENALTVILICLYLNIDLKLIQDKLNHLSPSPMRLEVINSIDNSLIINDTYSSDLTTINYALNFMEKIKKSDKKIVIMSDFQCSSFNEEDSYLKVVDWLNKSNLLFFIGIGNKFKNYANYFKIKSFFYNNVDEVIKEIDELEISNATILIKGARKFNLEKIINHIELKHNHTILKIDYNAIINNLNYYRSLVTPDTKIMVMLKAFSYGGGTFEIAKILQANKIDYIGVAYIDEGIELRNNGIFLPIMIMNPCENNYNLLFEYNLEPVIYSFKSFYELLNAAKYYSTDITNVHIEIDTGMHRLGFLPDECNLLLEELKKQKYLKVKSIFSHLSAAENPIHDNFTLQQVKSFSKVVDLFKKELPYSFLSHILNTAGIERFSNYCFDMVRLGIGLYGFGTNKSKSYLQNVFSFITNISQIKWLKPPETVGYERKGILSRDTKVAIIPVGYADGLHRNLGNGNYSVKINGQNAPIIGNICMDMCMIDVTDIAAKEGDEVVIFDSVDDILRISKILNTIPYEVLTSISYRVKRVYYYE
ncbi:MAG: bifunctional UDP-N-acetylmuramoyl-tripeptide:D-alanyl-D-alanine ligase/alanine racemase [Bacteroidales bacterium]|nr:bifunctional UDP-N-acetylmuramoyl-tripeptide:D-alanyl-D-alanine ligase/alanine racemase [Bacteroidales bacterium]